MSNRTIVNHILLAFLLCYCSIGAVKANGPQAISTISADQANWTATGESQYRRFGRNVSTAGDINGDGYDDIMVAALPDLDAFDTFNKVYMFYGSATGLAQEPGWSLTATTAFSGLGRTIMPAGDVNGDGYDDIAIDGGAYYDFATFLESRVFVYCGTPEGPGTTANWTVHCDRRGTFGNSMAAGDINGDGYSDIIIGESTYQNDKGRFDVYYGSSSGLSTTAGVSMIGNRQDDFLGHNLTSADVNGDGYSDLIASSPTYNHTILNEGRVVVYYGSATGLSTEANWTLYGMQELASLGQSLCSAGDINNDGYDDVIVSRFNAIGSNNYEQQFYGYFGSDDGLGSSPDWIFKGDIKTYGTVANAGDVDGDGYDDILIGPPSDVVISGSQEVLLYCGSAMGLSQQPHQKFRCEQDGASFNTIAMAGDGNNDGYDDILIGAPYYDAPLTDQGQVFCYYGSGVISSVSEPRSQPLAVRLVETVLPSGKALALEIESGQSGILQAQLCDIYGRPVAYREIHLQSGLQHTTMQLPGYLASGRYFLHTTLGDVSIVSPLTIIR